MASGPIGNLSQQVMKYSGLLFGLMSVTQLLTQTKIAALAAERLSIASSAMKMAKGGGGIAGMSGVLGKSGLIGKLARVGFGFAKLIGPLGGAAIAATAAYSAFKFIKKTQEDARLKVEGLGEAARLTAAQLGQLAPLLGFTEGPSPFANIGKETKIVSDPQRQKMDEIKKVLAEDKSFQENIKSIREGTDSQINSVLTAQSVDFLAKGAPKENVQAYIDALLEEAGKTKVNFKVDSIDITSKKGQEEVVKNAQSQVNSFDKAYQDAIKKSKAKSKETGYTPIAGSEQEKRSFKNNLTKEQQKDLNLIPNALVAGLTATKRSFQSGKIGIEDYNTTINGLVNSLQSGQGSLLVGIETIKQLALEGEDEALAKAAGGITKNADAILVLQAATAGIPDIVKLINALKVINDPKSTLQALTAAEGVVAKAKENIEKNKIKQEKAAEKERNAYLDGLNQNDPTVKSPFELATDQLKNQRTEMSNTITSYDRLTKSGIKAGKAFEIAKDPILAAAVATTKVGTKEWKTLLGLIKETDATLIKSKLTGLKADTAYTKQFTAIVPVLKDLGLKAEEIDDIFSDPSFAQQFINGIKDGKVNTQSLKTLIDETVKNRNIKIKFDISKMSIEERTSALIDLREKLIDLNFAPKLKEENDKIKEQEKLLQGVNDKIKERTKTLVDPLTKKLDANNFALEKISLQEDAINEKYDIQTKALEKIKTLNQDISNVQKQRLGIADALSSGNISQAVQLIQDARAQQAESAVSREQEALTGSRDAAIEALGRNKLEKENKQLQYDISVIEKTILSDLTKQKEEIEGKIDASKRVIDEIQLEVETLKNTALYAGQTRKAIEDQQELIRLANAAGITYNDTLIKQLANAQGIWAAIKNLDTTVDTIHNIKTVNSSDTPTVSRDAILAQFGGSSEQKAKIPTPTPTSTSTTGKGVMVGGRFINYKSKGGIIPKYMARGGKAIGSDTVPAMLTPGEFIVNRAAAAANGPMLKSLNESKYPSMLGASSSPAMPVVNSATSLSDNSTAVYNYTLGFNINGSTSNPNDIARAVIKEIKQIDSQRIRGSRR
jgi:hypothetical protein